MIEIMIVLLRVSENLFFSVLLLIDLQDIKLTRNLESNFLEDNKNYFLSCDFFLEDDDNKLVDFNGATISFTCQILKLGSYERT